MYMLETVFLLQVLFSVYNSISLKIIISVSINFYHVTLC